VIRSWLAGVSVAWVWAAAASGQVVNPADKQREMQESSEESKTRTVYVERQAQAAPEPRASYELPPVEVVGEPVPANREEQRIGPYAQPRWTARRTFPSRLELKMRDGSYNAAPFANVSFTFAL